MAKKLSVFLIELLEDPEKQKKYKKNPNGYIDASDLSDAHKKLLKSDDLSGVQQEVEKEKPGAKAYRIFAIW
jgi:hypothetical protein